MRPTSRGTLPRACVIITACVLCGVVWCEVKCEDYMRLTGREVVRVESCERKEEKKLTDEKYL